METFTDFFRKEGREIADVVLFDIDGTLSFGRRPLPGAEDLLNLLNKEQFPYLLLTNDCGRSHEQKAEILQRGGLPVSADHIFSCGDALKIWEKQSSYDGELFFLCGSLGSPCYARQAGIRVTADPDLIHDCAGVIFGEGQYDWQKCLEAVFNFFLEHPDAPFIVGNPDSYWPALDHPGMGLGSGAQARFVLSVLKDAGKNSEIFYLGKPYPAIYSALKAELTARLHKEIAPERIIMVGDSLASDIRGANANGLLSCLVLSGITTAELAAAAPEDRIPDMIFSGV
jgi:HAD superfamily hydrolase (TIGR01450 family)